MSGYLNMTLDFSDVAPDKKLLSAMKWKREHSKPIRDWARIKIGGETVGYACSPRCCDISIAIIVAEYDEAGLELPSDPYLVGLTDRQGIPAADYKHVRCYLGCKWRVV